MKFGQYSILLGSISGVILSCILGTTVYAEPESVNQSGTVTVEGSSVTKPIDPENPGIVVDPGTISSTNGSLRIDYVSALDFGESKVGTGLRKYNARAQQFFGDTGPRGSYIQITNQQSDRTGWSLQVKQESQFNNPIIQEKEEQELKGAVLSLDKGWANSTGTSETPIITRETISLDSIGSAYEVATARKDSGKGVWTIAFGASESNKNGQAETLSPVVDGLGEPVIDQVYNKPVYSNSAITLTVPETTIIHPVKYNTELTWIIAKLP